MQSSRSIFSKRWQPWTRIEHQKVVFLSRSVPLTCANAKNPGSVICEQSVASKCLEDQTFLSWFVSIRCWFTVIDGNVCRVRSVFDLLNDYNWQPSMFPKVDNVQPRQSILHPSGTRTSFMDDDRPTHCLTEHRLKLRKVNWGQFLARQMAAALVI